MYHFTTKAAFTDRCTYVHQHGRDEKGPGIVHYDSSFRNNNEAYPPRHALRARNSTFGTRPRARKQGNFPRAGIPWTDASGHGSRVTAARRRSIELIGLGREDRYFKGISTGSSVRYSVEDLADADRC